MSKLSELSNSGQSVWYDYIRRSFITSGELQVLIDEGLRGVTSNPSIFEKAIAGSSDYDTELQNLVKAGKSVDEIYETLTLEDIARTADLLLPVYKKTGGLDGYVSLEVSPKLANDTDGTVSEAKRLFAALNRPNVMIKVPATPAGIPAIAELIAAAINVNVTLIFGLGQYRSAAEAYLTGLEKLQDSGGDPSKVASVASFFISRIDTAVDQALESKKNQSLQGKVAIANAKMAYSIFQQVFDGEPWQELASQGARVQRLLWASTGTKNPLYSDVLYVESLIGENTVNTVPPATLNAFRDHGKVEATLLQNLDAAKSQLEELQGLGIDLQAITGKLLQDGVAAFAKSFESLLGSIAQKQERLLAGEKNYTGSLGDYRPAVEAALSELREHEVMKRLWAHEYTLWKPEPTEISNRLGWLHSPEVMVEHLPKLRALVDAVRAEGYTHALLLGMGGSSLAPGMFRLTFGVKEGYLALSVLDSTDPGAVLAQDRRLDPGRTVFLVATKSGGTVETLSFFKYFYNRVVEVVGAEQAGKHFVAITDPGSRLVELAGEYEFRATFLNDPNIGGRYSALSNFGLVPAALIGMDLGKLLDRAATMACNCESCNCPVEGDNAGAWLGAVLGELAASGKDKLTLIASPPIAPFGAWAEQLMAESTGKEGKGILPVEGEAVGTPEVYARDRLFVYLRLKGDDTWDAQVQALKEAGLPVVQINLGDLYDLGGEFFRWEIATVIAGRRLGINPFDQPNVESAKVLARQMVDAYQEEGTLPALVPSLEAEGMMVYWEKPASSLKQTLSDFLAQASPGDQHGSGRSYAALQAYIQPTREADLALQSLRTKLRDRLHLATTVGYGPRFLHSTGQLHKGDAGRGLFIQLTADMPEDAAIPDKAGGQESSISFGVLKMAQALGDRQALLEAGRKVIRFHLGRDVVHALKRLEDML